MSRTLLRLKHLCLLLLLLPAAALSQTSDVPPPTPQEAEMLISLASAQRDRPSQVSTLLQANRESITPRLWQQVMELAARLYEPGSARGSLALYEIAKQIAAQLQDRRLLAMTHHHLGRTRAAQHNLAQAITEYQTSQRIFEEIGAHRDLIYLLSDLSTLCFILEDYPRARAYAQQSIELASNLRSSTLPAGAWPDEYGVAGAFATLGEITSQEGDHVQALEHLHRALALYQQLNGAGSSYSVYIADVYTALGRVLTIAGDYRQAFLHLNRALEITRGSSYRERTARTLNALGFLLMEQEDYGTAKGYFEQSLRIHLELNDQREATAPLLNLGVIEQRQGNYEQSLVYFRRSHQAAETSGSRDDLIASGEGIGVALNGTGNITGAIEQLTRSLALAREWNNQLRQCELLWRLAEVEYGRGDYARTITLARESIELARRFSLPKLHYLALTTLGRAYARQNEIGRAYQALAQAITQIEDMRIQVAGSERERQLFFERRVDPYRSMIEMLIAQGRRTEAFIYAERSKGRVLLDVLRRGRVNINRVLTANEREEERRLHRELGSLNAQIFAENQRQPQEETRLRSLNERLERARSNYETFQIHLFAAHPELAIQRGQIAPLTIEQVAQMIPNDTAVLEYVVTEQRTYLFVLTRREASRSGAIAEVDIQVYPLAITSRGLTARVSSFRNQLAERNLSFGSAARQLYDSLVRPAEQQLAGKTTVCIIPDGPLWEMPFQALRNHTPRYLIEDHAVFYAQSLSVLREMQRRQASEGNTGGSSAYTLLAFGNPSLGNDLAQRASAARRGKRLVPLPEAENEVRTLAQFYGAGRSRIYIGREAREERFRTEAGRHRVLHFATHGLLDDVNPMYSHVLLAQGENGSQEDGLLEAREILNLDLRADLVVLSACETARGRVATGEGVIGMTWAFFIAGCPATVASQWNVESRSTSRLMVEFHRNLSRSSSRSATAKADALRHASLRLLSSDEYNHPFYWAGFVLVGDPR